MHPRPINSNLLSLLFVGLLFWLAACKQEPEPALDESPRILSMSLTGIPQENITIDQQAQAITVLLPASLAAFEMTPSFTVSRQAQVEGAWGRGERIISLAKYCPCDNNPEGRVGQFKFIEPLQVVNRTHTSHYTIQLKTTGAPLRIKPLTTPIIADSKSEDYSVVLPVENNYGRGFVQAIAVTKTGADKPYWIGGGFCFEICTGLLNQIKIPLAGYKGTGSLRPGLHDLDLLLIDGTKLHVDGAILVK
jgi:hypothetical protein